MGPEAGRYTAFSAWLRQRFGERVQKIMVDAGLNCPNRDGTLGTGGCIYCNARGSGTGAFDRGVSIRDQVIAGRDAVLRRYKARKYLVYFQSFSNTYAPVDRLRAIYDEAVNAVDGVAGLSIGTRPDCVDGPVLDLLAEYAAKRMVWVEYGLQSTRDATLRKINRGHDFACFRRAVRETRARGLRVCAHVILGLPGEGPTEMSATADALADLGVDGIKLHLLYVVRGTPLEQWYRSGDYRPMEPEAYAEAVCEFLERTPPDVVIQRLTGDPHPEELVAPEWALQKHAARKLIFAEMERRDVWQGKALGISRGNGGVMASAIGQRFANESSTG
ncbi:MAG: TIGR01212 family radical SAM protein [Desulfococcaceae bacterium]